MNHQSTGHLDQAALSLAVIMTYQETFGNAWTHTELSKLEVRWVMSPWV